MAWVYESALADECPEPDNPGWVEVVPVSSPGPAGRASREQEKPRSFLAQHVAELTDERDELRAALEGIRDFMWEDGKAAGRVVDALKRRAESALDRFSPSGEQECDHDWFKIPTNKAIEGNGYSVCKRCGRLRPPGEGEERDEGPPTP